MSPCGGFLQSGSGYGITCSFDKLSKRFIISRPRKLQMIIKIATCISGIVS